VELTAIDAKDYRYFSSRQQYLEEFSRREVLKAYAGFYSPGDGPKRKVATGNWGCGAFLGDKFHKPFLQYIAASEADRDMLYCTFKDIPQTEALQECVTLLRASRWLVKDLWNCITSYDYSRGTFVSYLKDCLSQQ